MGEVRVRNLDAQIVDSLAAAASQMGRSLESHVRSILKEASESGVGQFPIAADWLRAGFEEVHELIPGRQYLVWAATRPFRITITRSLTGDDPEWNTLIEESHDLSDDDGNEVSVWARATEVAESHLGDSPAMALRDAIRWLSDYAGVDPVSRSRKVAARGHRLSPKFREIIERLDPYIDGTKTFPRDNIVIWTTPRFEIYVNKVDEQRGALMVYRVGESWSITNGKATYFPLDKSGADVILTTLAELGVQPLAQLGLT